MIPLTDWPLASLPGAQRGRPAAARRAVGQRGHGVDLSPTRELSLTGAFGISGLLQLKSKDDRL